MKRLRGKLAFANVVLAAIAALLVAPTMAAAADSLYATPDPALGANCSAESPCSLTEALSTAVSGDTVVVGVGSYEPQTGYSDEGKSLDIEGAEIGIGRPVVDGEFELTGSATRLSDIEVYSDGGGRVLNLGGGAEADRVISISALVDACGLESTGATIANSLCVSENPTFFSGLSTQSSFASEPMTIRNVTMIGDIGFYSGAGEVTVTDSIAKSTESGGEDAALGSETVNALRSYLKNQSGTPKSEVEPLTAAPVFLGPKDFREAPGSPSIDFGSESSGAGELDLDGNLRTIGAKTDIGAYEFVPDAPSVSSPSATSITESSATVGATINPNSGRTYYHLEYGPTSAYGSSTPVVVMPAATAGSAVQVALSNLTAGSTVHYSLVATSDGGTTRTPDATFTTVSSATSATSAPETKVSNPAPPVSPTPKLAPILTFKAGKPKGRPLLDRSAIKLSTGCGPIACGVTVSGTVKVGSKSLGTLPGPKTASHWQAGKQGAMKLRISSKIQSRVRAYLEADPTARAKILVTATYVTAAGEKATRKLTIHVRPL